MRRATLPPVSFSSVVVISRGEIPPREIYIFPRERKITREGNWKEESSRNAFRVHDAFTRVLVLAIASRRAGWIGARRCADRSGVVFLVISGRECEIRVGRRYMCFVQRRASEPARSATYPTRGSELTERTPKREGAGGRIRREAQIGADTDRDLSRNTGYSYRPRRSLILMTSEGWKTFILSLLRSEPCESKYFWKDFR